MFGLFKSKPAIHYTRLDDVMWKNESARLNGIPVRAHALGTDGSQVVIASRESAMVSELRSALGDNVPALHIVDRHQLNPARLQPLLQHNGSLRLMLAEFGASIHDDDALLAALNQPALAGLEIEFHTSLEDPAMQFIITDKLRDLMNTLGVEPDEPLEHRMITRALDNARRTKAKSR